MSVSGNWERQRVGAYARLGEIDRRRFIALSGMGAAALISGVGPFAEEGDAQARLSGYPFALGVASGDPEPDGVVLWTRLAPEPLAADGRGGMPRRKVRVRWEVATDEGFTSVVRRGVELARPALAHSVHVEVDGLSPAREYYYRFEAGSELSPVGRTKTAPAPGADVSELAFAFASCQQYEHGYFTAYKHMAEEDLDLVIHLGDYIYEYGKNEYVAPGGNVRNHVPGTEITTLADYRVRHGQYKSTGNLRRAHAAFPWVVTWDDHEVENNYADEISEDDTEPDQDPEVFLRRRAAAYQAYYENMPLRRSSVPRGPDMRLYRRLTYGGLAEFNVLDTRQYRTDQPCGDAFPADCAGRFGPEPDHHRRSARALALERARPLPCPLERAGPADLHGPDRPGRRPRRGLLRRRVGRVRRLARPAARLRARAERLEPRGAHRRLARELAVRPEGRFRRPRLANGRGGVRWHLDHLHRLRRDRSPPTVGWCWRRTRTSATSTTSAATCAAA